MKLKVFGSSAHFSLFGRKLFPKHRPGGHKFRTAEAPNFMPAKKAIKNLSKAAQRCAANKQNCDGVPIKGVHHL